MRGVSHTDTNGTPISPEQYNAAGDNAMAGMTRGSTGFEWLKAAEIDSLTLLDREFLRLHGPKEAD